MSYAGCVDTVYMVGFSSCKTKRREERSGEVNGSLYSILLCCVMLTWIAGTREPQRHHPVEQSAKI